MTPALGDAVAVKVVDVPLHLGAMVPLLEMIGAVPPVRFTVTLNEKDGFVHPPTEGVTV